MTARHGCPSRTLAVVSALGMLAACGDRPAPAYQGYAEGEYVLIAAPTAGKLEKRFVNRGDSVKAGAPLFALEQENEAAARREAQARLAAGQARVANLAAARRAPEIDAIRAQAQEAAAALRLSAQQLAQQEKLYAGQFISKAAVDASRAAYDRDAAHVREVQAQLKNATLGIGRDQEVAAAQSDAQTAQEALAQSDWQLARRAAQAPAAALVQDTFYSEGEWVPAGTPVVSLLPPGNIKLRFFVPEPGLAALATGRNVLASCDGCVTPIKATISFISRQAEYTPPVIYSREQRAKLVYLVEARPAPADATRLKPGQPVDVTLP